MTTTLEAPAEVTPETSPTPVTQEITRPIRLFIPLTKTRRHLLLAFLRQVPNDSGLLVERTESETLLTFSQTTLRPHTATFTIPHVRTQEPAAVQLQRHRLYAGSFWLDDADDLLRALSKIDPANPGILTLDFARHRPDGADITYTLLGRPCQHPIAARSIEHRIARDQTVSHVPPMDEIRLSYPTLNLNATWLTGLLQRTRPAISKDETRYVLNGIYFHFDADDRHRFRAVATDGRRLHLEDWPLHPASVLSDESLPPVIVPTDGIATLHTFLGTTKPNPYLTGAVFFATEETHAYTHLPFKDGSSITLSIPTLEGNYPNYPQVITPAANHPYTLTVDNPADAARTASLIGTIGGKIDHIHLIIDGTRAYLRGTGNAYHPFASVTGPTSQIDPLNPFVAAFNRAFFIDAIPHFTHLHFTDPETPLTLTAPHRTHILMPMRVTA